MSKTNSLAVAGLTLLGASMHLSALTIATRGLGQVLEFPYYTVNGNQNTLITLVNSTQRIKAMKARFREGYNGRVVAQFNVYLSPFDVWTGAILSDNGTVAIGTRDNSCTVPAFSSTATSVNIPALAFNTQNFTGAEADTGPTDTARLNEGHFEIFEMGEITGDENGFALDIDHVNGVPPGCAQLVTAWAAGGVWATNASADLTPPGGGLFGSAAVVDVANGTFYSILPTVLDGFSTTVQHTAATSAAPDFDTLSAGGDGKYSVSVDAGGHALNLHYAKPVDAVSALFMANQILNEYETFDSAGAQSDWQVTFPTKHFYVDNKTSASPPFENYFGEFDDESGSCVGFDFTLYDREEAIVSTSSCTSPCTPGQLHRGFCYETDVVTLSAPLGTALRSRLAELFGPDLTDGHMNFDYGTNYPEHKLAASVEGVALRGLPVVGFLAENYINANVTPGVLANYTVAIPHHSTIACGSANGACP